MKATPKMLLATGAVLVGLAAHAVTYYVDAKDGNDSNAGTSPGLAFKTWGKAIGTVSEKDFSSDPAEVVFKAGTYTASGRSDLKLGRGKVMVRGETGNPADVTIKGSENSIMTVVVTNTADELVIHGLTFRDGVGKWGYPGGVMVGSESLATQGRMVVSNCVFTGCVTPSGDGGAIRASGSDTHIVDCTFADNFSTNCSGGAISVHKGTGVHFSGCTFMRNRCMPDYYSGGAILVKGSAGTSIANCSFYTNSVNQYGGAIYLQGGASAKVSNCVFDGNQVSSTGDGHGAGIALRSSAKAVVTDCVFTNNYSGRHAACIWSDGANLVLVDSTLACNTSKQIGGCIHAGGASRIFMTNVTAQANTQSAGGGGVFAAEGTGQGELVGCAFISNHSDSSNGGAVFVSSGAFTLTNCLFTGNSASMGGGVCYASDKGLANLIVDCEFRDNKAELGGGLCVKGSDLVVRASRFFGNSVKTDVWTADSQYGGAIANASTLTLSDASVITGLKVRDCVFGGNRGCRGGAFFNGQFNTYTIENCIFTNNLAYRFGGGAYVRDDDADGRSLDVPTVFRGCLFAGNSVTGNYWNAEGGGIYVAGAKAAYGTCPRLIESCTIVANSISSENSGALAGPGVALNPSFRCVVSNSIVAFNLWQGQASSLVYTYTQVSTLNNCCAWPSNESAFKGENNCLNVNPQFVDAAGGNYRLAKSSPCRRKGAVAGWMADAVDLDGNPRLGGLNHDMVDMGAWQIQSKVGLTLYLR